MIDIQGYLEIFPKGFGFLRLMENNFRPTNQDVFVSPKLIRSLKLREGLHIRGRAEEQPSHNKGLQLIDITFINEKPPDDYHSIDTLRDQTSINPNERLSMCMGEDDRTGRILDLITPLGRGQRGLVISPPKAGKTTILKHIAAAVIKNHPSVKAYVLLIDERPEEVTDFRRSLEEAVVLSSSADESLENHLRMTRLAMHACMRQAEYGNDVLVLIDSLTRMGRAFNRDTDSHSRTMTGGLGANALELPRRFFGSARKIEDGGSLTIMASILVNTGSRMDDIIFQEFKGTGNLDLVLSKKCAERRIFPALNINESGTRKEHLLLNDGEYRFVAKLRKVLAQLGETEAMHYLLNNISKSTVKE